MNRKTFEKAQPIMKNIKELEAKKEQIEKILKSSSESPGLSLSLKYGHPDSLCGPVILHGDTIDTESLFRGITYEIMNEINELEKQLGEIK